MTLRSIRHPGPASEPRVLAQPCSARTLTLTFQPGRPVLDAVANALAAKGIDSAVIEIAGGSFDPLVYVIPAPSPDETHAAWYSDTRRPKGRAQLERVVMSFGQRQNAPFIHCHGIWIHADGVRAAGHLIPHEAAFGEPVEATVHALSGAIFDQQPDSETNFPLLTPVAHGAAKPGEARAVLLRVKPNTDLHAALEDTARSQGFASATVHGIGSLVGCDFADGSHMASYASELFISNGRIADGRATIEIGVVDIDAAIFEGVVKRGGNGVCVTCELLVVER
jgi:predicted DNA-binding protein with PD1-like motif